MSDGPINDRSQLGIRRRCVAGCSHIILHSVQLFSSIWSHRVRSPFGSSVTFAANDYNRGCMTYVVLNGFTAMVKFASGNRIVPADYDAREFWTCQFTFIMFPLPCVRTNYHCHHSTKLSPPPPDFVDRANNCEQINSAARMYRGTSAPRDGAIPASGTNTTAIPQVLRMKAN